MKVKFAYQVTIGDCHLRNASLSYTHWKTVTVSVTAKSNIELIFWNTFLTSYIYVFRTDMCECVRERERWKIKLSTSNLSETDAFTCLLLLNLPVTHTDWNRFSIWSSKAGDISPNPGISNCLVNPCQCPLTLVAEFSFVIIADGFFEATTSVQPRLWGTHL